MLFLGIHGKVSSAITRLASLGSTDRSQAAPVILKHFACNPVDASLGVKCHRIPFGLLLTVHRGRALKLRDASPPSPRALQDPTQRSAMQHLGIPFPFIQSQPAPALARAAAGRRCDTVAMATEQRPKLTALLLLVTGGSSASPQSPSIAAGAPTLGPPPSPCHHTTSGPTAFVVPRRPVPSPL